MSLLFAIEVAEIIGAVTSAAATVASHATADELSVFGVSRMLTMVAVKVRVFH